MRSPAVSTHRAALYCRVSTTGQEEEGTSLQSQEAHARAYATAHGYTVDEAHVYRETFSGIELWHRPRLTTLREAIRRKEVQVVIAYAIDRLARDPVHLGVILSEAEYAGVAVEFVSEPLDHSPEGQLIRFVRGYAAKVEHLKIVERTQRGKRAKAEQGKPPGIGRPCYGYRWRDEAKSGYEHDPVTAPIVARMYREVLAGTTLRRLARDLTDEGIITPRGSTVWRPSTISALLKHPIYCGRPCAYRWQQVWRNGSRTQVQRPPDEWIQLPPEVAPAIVDAATWEATRIALERHRAHAARNNRYPEEYLLRGGYARCAHCEAMLHCNRTHQRCARGRIYRCDNPRCTSQATVMADTLEADVWARVESLLLQPDVIAAELARHQSEDPTVADLAAVERALSEVDKKQANLARALAVLADDAATPVVTELTALAEQRRRLTAERETLKASQASWAVAQDRLTELTAWCQAVAANLGNLTYAHRRMALDALGVQARVWKGRGRDHWEIIASILLEPASIVSEAS